MAMNNWSLRQSSIGFTVKPTQAHRPPSFIRLKPPSFRSIGFFKDAFGGPLLKKCNPPFARGGITEIGTETVIFGLIDYGKTPSRLSTYKILEPGMIILENYASLRDQVDIVTRCEMFSWGFYMYQNDIDHRRLMCFGRNWEPETGYKNHYISFSGQEPVDVPSTFVSLAEAAIKDAQIYLDGLPSMCPETCVARFYQSHGRLGLHQDWRWLIGRRSEGMSKTKKTCDIMKLTFIVGSDV